MCARLYLHLPSFRAPRRTPRPSGSFGLRLSRGSLLRLPVLHPCTSNAKANPVFSLVSAPEVTQSVNEAVAREARTALTAPPKPLSPWLFYDETGSRLFEQITELPEYYLTRTERCIFTAHADEIIEQAIVQRTAASASQPAPTLTLIELGAGTATNTGLLLTPAVRQQGSVVYPP